MFPPSQVWVTNFDEKSFVKVVKINQHYLLSAGEGYALTHHVIPLNTGNSGIWRDW